jgi:peptidoglycan/xylan/chitin deacetylase (PgdA/CDA1 family)
MLFKAAKHRASAQNSLPRRLTGTLLSAALVIGLMLVVGGASPASAATGTVVSITFDDANADQLAASQKLTSKGMNGTFYLNSGFIGATNYLTLANVQAMKAAGHEIASHTISHPDLAGISLDEAKRQMCNDRVNWANMGLPVANFAYPFASSTTAVENASAACGNNSSRGLGDVKTRFSCTNCVVGETIPPADKNFTRAPDQVESTWTLADLQKSVTQAEAKNNNSWVQLTFHHICTGTANGCAAPSTTPAIYNAFIDWLATRPATTKVKTVGAVIGGTTKPAVAGPVAPAAAPGVNAIKNPSMETFNAATGLPQCYLAGGYGSNTAAFSVSTAAHTGTSAVQVTVSNYVDGDAKLVPSLDLGECAPTVSAGKTYNLSEWYTSTAPTQFALYYRTPNGLWNYWTSSPWYAASATYAQATWVTPAMPANATAISFGLNLFNNGTITTDDLSMVETGTAPAGVRAEATSAFTASTSTAPPADHGQGPRKKKGDRITKHDTVPAPIQPRLGRGGKQAAQGVAPGEVVLQPFVVSPELTRG